MYNVVPADEAKKRVVTFLLVVLFLIVSNSMAFAKCRDRPEPEVDWSNCSKERLMLGGQDLSGGIFEGAFLSGTGMQEANLAGANLHLSEIVRTAFNMADLTGANLEKALASRADFSGATLINTRLVKAEFLRVKFVGADLTGANLANGDFYRNDFSGAKLVGADMTGAIMPRSVFLDADMTGAVMTDAFIFRSRLEGVDLSQAVGLTQSQLEQACGDNETKLPEGLTIPSNWPCNAD